MARRHLRRRIDGLSHRRHDGQTLCPKVEKSPEAIRKAIEEYAVECSIIKVAGSEMLDFVVDETVQIYGGYGFVEEYPAERAYRDSRVNRIFEGTNEINRLIITGWLLKRAMSGQLALLPAIKKTMDEVMAGPSVRGTGRRTGRRTQDGRQRQEARHAGGRCGFAEVHAEAGRPAGNHGRDRRHGDRVVCHGFCLLRARKHIEANGEAKGALVTAMTQVYIAGAMGRLEAAAKKVIAAVAEGDMLRTQMAIVRRLAKHEPVNVIALQEKIAARVLETGKYVTV